MLQNITGLFFFAVLLSGPLPLCAAVVSAPREKESEPRFSHSLFVLLTCWCLIQASVGLLLGIFSLLTQPLVLFCEVIIFLAGILFFIFSKRRLPSHLLKLPRDITTPGKIIIGIVCATGIILLWVLLTNPIKDYDSLAYHLPAMAKWYQAGSLELLDDAGKVSRYPFNWEVLCSLFIMPFRDDFPAAFPNLIAWILFGLAVYRLSREAGVKRIFSLTYSALLLTLPIVLLNVNTMHIDLPFASFFMAALYFILYYSRAGRPGYLVLFLLSLGMLMGTKTSGIVYGFFLALVFAAVMIKRIYGTGESPTFVFRPFKKVIPIAVMAGLLFFLLAGYWYVRNFIELGNPIGLFKVKIGDIVLFPGKIPQEGIFKTTLAGVFEPADVSHWKILLKQIVVQGGIPILVMAASAFLFLFTFARGKEPVKKHIFIGLTLLLAGTFILYWLTPYSATNKSQGLRLTPWMGQNIRLAFPFVGLLGVVSAAGTKKNRIPDIIVPLVVLVSAAAGICRLAKHFDTAGENPIYTLVFLLLPGGAAAIFYFLRRFFKPTLLLIPVLIAAMLLFAREKREINRSRFFGGVQGYIENNLKRGDIIGYFFLYPRYLFYGNSLRQKITRIPRKKGIKKGFNWLNIIRAKGIRYLALGPLGNNELNRRIVEWVKNPGSPFVPVFGEDPTRGIVIYRLTSTKKDNVEPPAVIKEKSNHGT